MEYKPIDWDDVAIVAFRGDRPVIITSVKPEVMFVGLQDLIEDEPDDCFFGETVNERSERILKAISELRWELHPIEQARELFGSLYAKTEGE